MRCLSWAFSCLSCSALLLIQIVFKQKQSNLIEPLQHRPHSKETTDRASALKLGRKNLIRVIFNKNLQSIIIMNKISLLAACLLLTVASTQDHINPAFLNEPQATNGTESYFFSPHGLGRTPEVSMALDKIQGQVKVRKTSCNISAITYILDNFNIGIVYNPSKQITNIPKADLVEVKGGRFEITYKFNYTKIENRNNITGYAFGSVLTDSVTYYKEFSFCQGFLCWRMPPAKGMEHIELTQNKMLLKRMEPFNQTDLNNIQLILDNATTSIEPANVKSQFMPAFNQIFPLALNDSLNHEIFGENINYTFHSNTHGDIKMNLLHQVYSFGIDPQLGYKLVFVGKIEGYGEERCDITVPVKPKSFESYGGSQAFHLNCFYEQVVYYLQSNGWLDTALNSDWEVDAFQFYAGDLFDVLSTIEFNFSARAILDGSCQAQKENLKFYSAREFDSNTYALLTTYKCSLKGTNQAGTTVQVMKFTAKTRLLILAQATTKTLSFKIVEAGIDDISFEPVGNYFVKNFNLAKYRAEKVVQKMLGSFTFGTGFPTVARQLPKTTVSPDYVFYYDNSHFDTLGGTDTTTDSISLWTEA